MMVRLAADELLGCDVQSRGIKLTDQYQLFAYLGQLVVEEVAARCKLAGIEGLVPCTPFGCVALIKKALGDDLSGKNAVIIGRSNIVGKPMASLLLKESCTVTIAHSRTVNLPDLCRTADILVAAVGRAEMVKGDWIKPGATLIDVGINRIDKPEGGSKLLGDVDFAEAAVKAGAITPVPGGVGPMTIACLLRNAVVAACHQNQVDTGL